MLWRFSFATNSTLDALLSRETPPSVEELMDEQDILNECKAQNNKLANHLSREESIRSLLGWVVAGLDDLDQQAASAETECLSQSLLSPDLYPSYRPSISLPTPGPGPNSPPLQPTTLPQDVVDIPKDSEENQSNGFVGSLGEIAPGKENGVDEELHRATYSRTATEILCCQELWSIADTIMRNPEALLTPFWDAVLTPLDASTTTSDEDTMSSALLHRHEESERERARNEFWSDEDEERDRKREVIRGMWMRVNGSLMTKRTADMIRFIQTLPDIVDRIMARIASPAVQDALIRIVSSEEGGVTGVIDWLADQGLIPKLLELLSPHHSATTHNTVAELIKTIITLCAPTPFNPHGGNGMEQQAGQGVQPPGTRDNRLIRELVSETSVKTLTGFMLDDIEITDKDWNGLNGSGEEESPADPFIIHPLPSLASATSSLSHICNIFVEVIRRNNSDFSEPHLFHTLRNRLMSVRMQPSDSEGEDTTPTREKTEQEKEEAERRHMEDALRDMSSKMGIVHLGHLLDIISDRFADLHQFVLQPRSQARTASVLHPKPLTIERFRIVELYAELLHSSNMSILNRPPGTGPEYTEAGILSGGLEGLEALGYAIDGEGDGDQANGEGERQEEDQVTQARELPVSSGSTEPSLTGSDGVASDDEDILEAIDDDSTPSQSPAASRTLDPPPPEINVEAPPPPPSQADVARLRNVMEIESKPTSSSVNSEIASVSHQAVAAPSHVSTEEPSEADSDVAPSSLAPGDRLKRKYIEHKVVQAVVDLFFQFHNHDFMHHTVYDILQQILNGRLVPGPNRDLVIALLKEARLIERILDAQRLNDRMIAQPKTPRLAHMGHIILIAEELVKFFARCPSDLFEVIQDSFILSEWEAFVEGSLKETRAKDAQPLAGGKPSTTITSQQTGQEGDNSQSQFVGGTRRPEEEDSSDDDEDDGEQQVKFGEPLRRTVAQDGFASRGEYDAYDNEGDRDGGDEEGMDRFWRTAGIGLSRRPVDSSDDDDDDADWLRPSANTGWANNGGEDDDFGAWETGPGPSRTAARDEFEDDDGWGTFNAAESLDSNPENPFGDDNFAPSVRAEPLRHAEPLTPHDWASEFDRAFREAGDGDGFTEHVEGEGEGDGEIDDGEDVPAIVMPVLDDEDEERDRVPTGVTSRAGSWTFAGIDEGVDLPPTVSPTLPSEEFIAGAAELPSVPVPAPRAASASPERPRVQTSQVSPIPIRQSGSPLRRRSSSASSSSSSSSPTTTTGPGLGGAGKSMPIPIPSGSGTSPRRRLSHGHKPHPGHPEGSPRSPTHSSSLSSSGGSTGSLSRSNSGRSRKFSYGEAFSPPDPALIAAASEDSPLGPGVSRDTHIGNDGMLEREVEGRKIRVPQDEIVEAIERKAEDDAESEDEDEERVFE